MTEQLHQSEHLDNSSSNPELLDQQNRGLDLFAIEHDVNKNTIVPKELQSLVNDVIQDPPKPPETQDQEKIGELLKKGKIADALTKALDLAWSILFGSKKKAGLDDFKKYTVDFDKMDKTQLQEQIDRLQAKVKQSWLSVNQKLRFAYTLSRAKDAKIKKENPTMKPFEALAQNIQVGDVLLMNKDGDSSGIVDGLKSKVANDWLQLTSNSIWTHTVIITKVSGNNIEITHASGKAMKVVKEDLETYLTWYKATDICVLQQPPESRAKSIEHAYSLLDKPYDSKSATKQALLGTNNADDCYNCGELVADSLLAANPVKFKDLENKTFPSDFLLNNYILPSYMTTIVS
jgi:hypothetical protein